MSGSVFRARASGVFFSFLSSGVSMVMVGRMGFAGGARVGGWEMGVGVSSGGSGGGMGFFSGGSG